MPPWMSWSGETRQVTLGGQNDDLINDKRHATEEKCIDPIATQQPMASDLRSVLTCLNVTVELERMGDYVEGIGRINLMMVEAPPISPLSVLHTIAETARARDPGPQPDRPFSTVTWTRPDAYAMMTMR